MQLGVSRARQESWAWALERITVNETMRRNLAITAIVLAVTTGCGGGGAPPRSEDFARKSAPIPACIVRLPPRKGTGFVRNLREEQYWKVVYPEHDSTENKLPAGALACTGNKVLSDPILEGGEPWRGSWPLKIEEGDVVFGGGGDRLKAVWLRSHKFADGTAGGALAIVRTQEDYAEVYAVGAFRGRSDKTKISIERMGGEVVVSVTDDGCTGHAQGASCETMLTIFLPRKGRLLPVIRLPLERIAFAESSEPGIIGPTEYHLTTAPSFIPSGVKVLEQVRARDERARVLRKAELERVYVLQDERMVPSDDPLWPRIYPPAAKELKESKDKGTPPVDGKPKSDKK